MGRLRRAINTYLRGDEAGIGQRASLLRLKQIGFGPRVVYDIGAHRGDWTREATFIFPSTDFFLFEANADHSEVLKATGRKFFISALGRADSERRNHATNLQARRACRQRAELRSAGRDDGRTR